MDYFTKVTSDLCDQELIQVNPQFWEETRKSQPLPEYQKVTHPSDKVSVCQIRFMQESASGEFTGLEFDVFELAHDLQSGKAKISDFPKIEVWQDTQGRIWTIDHRRLIAILLSGTPKEIPVTFVDKETVMKNRVEFSTTTAGKKIYVWLTDNVALVVGNDNRCAESK